MKVPSSVQMGFHSLVSGGLLALLYLFLFMAASTRVQNEERLWDQIFAMRTIIGSKEMVQSSLGEELRALFVSVGVEPSLSLKNAPELSEVIDGLRALKSVVGVE